MLSSDLWLYMGTGVQLSGVSCRMETWNFIYLRRMALTS